MEVLEGILKSKLKPGRFKHTQGVVQTAAKLAKIHGVNLAQVRIAAWLHDCAKALDREEMNSLLSKAKADPQERSMTALWHAPVGALLARRDFGVRDGEVLMAIRFHSTGAPGMGDLQKLIFVADYIEPGRPAWPELKSLRTTAKRDLDEAYLGVLRYKLIDLLESSRPLHSRSIAAYHFALRQRPGQPQPFQGVTLTATKEKG